jgi:hypothetical protein
MGIAMPIVYRNVSHYMTGRLYETMHADRAEHAAAERRRRHPLRSVMRYTMDVTAALSRTKASWNQ